MSFLLRAALVIGALSFFAAQSRTPDGTPADRRAMAEAVANAASAGWSALPSQTREAVVAKGSEEALRGLAASASRDTLLASDRQPAWRGTGTR